MARQRYHFGDTVTVPASFVTRNGTDYAVLESPCCGARAWWPVWSLLYDYVSGWPSYVRCGRSHGGRSIGRGVHAGCDWRWSVTITTDDDGEPVDVIWTA